MNRKKHNYTLLLAIMLTLGLALPMGIEGVFAKNTDQTEQITESAAKSVEIAENAEESSGQFFYEQLMDCSSLNDLKVLLYDEKNSAALDALNEEELNRLLVRVDEIFTAIAEPTEADTILKEKLLKKLSEYADVTSRTNDKSGETGSPAETKKKKAAAKAAVRDEYIYFDLAAGDVNIGKETYTGHVYVGGTPKPVTGRHLETNKYYVYQSTATNKDNTGYAKQEDFNGKINCRVPEYDRVKIKVDGEEKLWKDYITNNTDVKKVSQDWETAAVKDGRTALGGQAGYNQSATGNHITFANESDYTADVTIDNIWTYYQKPGAKRSEGGITAHLRNSKNTKIQLRLKGDNRVGNIHYGALKDYNNQIVFSNGENENQAPGSITVADFPNDFKKNRWCSAIGGDDDNCDRSDGIVIDSGVIYAGTTSGDDCTAIGGGGNEYGGVTINGGIITAVSASTGTAIGGGIGWSSQGGNANVTINNGTVYAYNHGIGPDSGSYVGFVPAAAIGGGSASTNKGNESTIVTINGGTVYAQSMAGAAIGGGGSGTMDGGSATVNIKGGTVIAKSVGGEVKYNKDNNVNHSETVTAGASIGGGTGKTAGGTVTLNISEDNGKKTILRTGSIGGGLATQEEKPVGSANVTVTGGDITGQVVMAGGVGSRCSFDMSGGRIHDTNLIEGNKITDENIKDPNPEKQITYIRDNGGAVFMNDPNGVTTITGGIIEGCTANNGGAIYMNGGTANINGGLISNNKAIENGGGVYLPGGNFTLNGGTISGNSAKNGGGIFLSQAPTLNKGIISSNSATENGGGMYISDCVVELRPTGDVSISKNSAKNGAGIYIHDSSVDSGSSKSTNSDVDAVSTATPDRRVGLLVDSNFAGTLSFMKNKAGDNGGAVCVDKGHFYLYSDKTTITSNEATNGGGVAVLSGNFTMSAGSIGDGSIDEGSIGDGSIGEENKGNTATSGGGVYVSGGDIWLKGGSISHNTAKNGGGAYVGGNYNMIAGKVMSNEAANSGGGIYVNDGTVTMYGGNVDSNTADESGGGMYISSDTKEALVDIFSGSISGNKSKNSGGGVSVVSPSDKHIDVTVGVNCEHPKLPDGNYNPFDYPEDAGKCGKAHIDHNNHVDNIDGNKLQHSSCPQVKNNTATNNGGGFFLNSSNSDITIYCLEAQGNEATNDPDSYCMDVRGGKLQIGDEDFDIHIDHALSGAKGNTIIYGSIMVEGGQVDLYGEMENPKFMQDVKVDVTKEEDHYVDHRIIETGHHDYKVHYYENFKGDGDTPTGLYIARQYPDEEHADAPEAEKYKFTVMSSIFSRPGYKIVGWNEKPDDSGDKYEVNETYDLEKLKDDGKVGVYITADGEKHFDEYLLVLYAIWERSGYMLKFDPNVGEGETYTGTMKNQSVTVGLLDGSQTIEKNQFERPGYEFMGWTLTPTPSDADEVYKDGQPIEEDFTDEDGATVTLYAKWKRCDHDGFLTYTEDENILTQTCSKCGGHTATATLSAVDSTYDQKEHLATADFSENWIGDKPEISYEMAKNDTWDSEDSIDDDWNAATNPKPVHAGTYTAKITGKNETDNKEATAQVKYTISPVKWETPKTPQILFKVEKVDGVDKSIIEISEPIGDNIEYMIKRLDNGKIEDIPGHEGWLNYKEFSDIPFGYYYYFYAKMCADRDHLESEPSQSDAYLANGGNIVYIKNATGIKVVPDIGGGSFKYTVSADKGYHLRNYEYKESQAEIPGASGAKNEEGITISHSGPSDGEYKYEVNFKTGKVAYWQVTLEFSGAAKNASVSHKVTDGQVFRNFNNKATSISRDSAFTARFTVSDYIPDEYEAQVLGFSESLPKGTTVIMKTGGQYWHYELNEERSAIDLTDFTAMGGKGKFSFDKEGNSPETFTYQFIVDFSQSTGANITADIEVNLKLTAASPQNSASQSAPTVPETGEKHISLGIKEKAAFKLDLTSVFGKSATLKCDYTPSDGAASIWNDRQTALVLTATATSEVPADLTLTTVVDEKTVLYSMNSKKQFIIPLGKIGDSEVKTTLNSCLFGTAGKNLEFTAEWYVSKSNADKSPLNGYKAATCDKNINFSGTKDALPSVRIDDADRVCKPGGTLKIDVNYAGIPKGDEITAHLQSKTTDGQYDYTGANIKIPHDTNTNGKESIQFSMGKMDKGSYRILVIVQESGANILQVPYYFVIE